MIVLSFDKLGNLITKESTAGTETFTYDELNRLETETRVLGSQNTNATYIYSENGNLTSKAEETLTYDATQPHAVSSFKGTNFSYDTNGNMTVSTLGDFRRTINYSGLSKAYKIKNDNTNKTNYFIYDTNHSRIVRKDSNANMRTKLTHYIGNVEMIKSASNGNIKTYKRYIGALIIDLSSRFAPQENWKFNYQFKDHIGTSLSIITLKASGLEDQNENMSFDAWGQRRFVNNFTIADINLGDVQFGGLIEKTTKGFTGHEHLDETGIIHMNGRIYTAYTGRFLQADPLIQDPFDTQSLNRYTYVSNNPLSLSDPTGYFSVDAFMQSWGVPLIQLGIVMAAPYLGMNTIVAGALSGAVSGGTKGALIGAFTAYAFQGVGDYYSDLGAASSTGKVLNSGLSAGQFAGKVAMHGLVGGISTLAQGGKFGHGFASAGVTQVSSPAIGKLGGAGFSPTRVFVAAIVGGTVSQLTGGKFANGAVTGAFSRAFNHERHLRKAYKKLRAVALVASLKIEINGLYKSDRVQVFSLLIEIASSNKGYEMMNSGQVAQGGVINIVHGEGKSNSNVNSSGNFTITLSLNEGFSGGVNGNKIELNPLRVLAHEFGHVVRMPGSKMEKRGGAFHQSYHDGIVWDFENSVIQEMRPNWELREKFGHKYETE